MKNRNTNSIQLRQEPVPGTHILMFRGDTQQFTLHLSKNAKGKAWLRTNIGNAGIYRDEIINEVNNEIPRLEKEWCDIPMNQMGNSTFQITLPLCEVGHFEAKCFFLKDGESEPAWPEGDNIVVNVSPADVCCANIIYNTFVRQFGPNKIGSAENDPVRTNLLKSLDQEGYTVIPKSGTFRDLIKELDFIINDLGCRFIQLLPIHPTPTTYARMGRFGSPYAALSFTDVDPALAEFDPKATPLEQFIELVDAIHARNSKIILDIAINHTGWAATLHESHPEWLVRDEDGKIEMPGAWGVIWADLTRLDYTKKELWRYISEIFLTWCHRGVDGFRCDAGYMIPISAWKYILAAVRKEFPNTIFLLEGLGGKISVSRDILNRGNFDWAYSELFQNYNKTQIEAYLPEAIDISKTEGVMVNFAETHDNNRLASSSKKYAKMRTSLCALLAPFGAFGFAGGVEWYATEKIDVHSNSSLNWGANENQVEHISRLTAILKTHPAFHDKTELKIVPLKGENQILLSRYSLPTKKKILVAVNLDDENPAQVSWDLKETGLKDTELFDLINRKPVELKIIKDRCSLHLEPGEVLCLSPEKEDLDHCVKGMPERVKKQRLRAKVLDVVSYYSGTQDLRDFDSDKAAEKLADDPVAFCRELNPAGSESRVTVWKWPEDIKREVMVPSGHFLLVLAEKEFRADVLNGSRTVSTEESLPGKDGIFFGLFSPLSDAETQRMLKLRISVYSADKTDHAEANLLYLSSGRNAFVKKVFSRHELLQTPLLFSGTNKMGGLLRANIPWGALHSRYDALLAANLNTAFPEDRRVMFTRCRAWVVFQGYSRELNIDCLESFWFDYTSRGVWIFNIPTGHGKHIHLTICVEMPEHENTVRITFFRHLSEDQSEYLSNEKPVRLILRPDIEDRSCHENTKAYMGAENAWPENVSPNESSFIFSPSDDRHLLLEIVPGKFVSEPEWLYMIHRSKDKERGLDPDSDLFSPGYFYSHLKGGDSTVMSAKVFNNQSSAESCTEKQMAKYMPESFFESINIPWGWSLEQALKKALDHFVVKREKLKTVIAGYPWFLDWGRDSLIFSRGLIAAGKIDDARAVLKQFAQFEKNGTLPNMISGNNAQNIDTSDAPLWLFVAANDMANHEKNDQIFNEQCGDRTIRQILLSIGNSVIKGTPNNIKMDAESGLIFSPGHFTWMDTNHPAGTPREGYPIEIQALWYKALEVLCKIDSKNNGKIWTELAKKVKISIFDYFYIPDKGYLSDCLHAPFGTPAKNGEKTDALRPNQLFAITLDALTHKDACCRILDACASLLVPGAIRSLADTRIDTPLHIIHNGILLNDPHHPYQGHYSGDEDTMRKPAYHNGTAWTWLFPSFCEAWAKVYGASARETALSLLGSSTHTINKGCTGQVPEILDGNYPHEQRGADAQAWGASELLRVWTQLTSE